MTLNRNAWYVTRGTTKSPRSAKRADNESQLQRRVGGHRVHVRPAQTHDRAQQGRQV